jgi:hypothetical protein
MIISYKKGRLVIGHNGLFVQLYKALFVSLTKHKVQKVQPSWVEVLHDSDEHIDCHDNCWCESYHPLRVTAVVHHPFCYTALDVSGLTWSSTFLI